MVGHVRDWITTTVAIVNQTKYYFLDGRRIAMRKGDKVFYLYGDHLGSTTLATDENGDVTYDARYLPYGGERLSDGVSPTDFGFTDQRNEVGLGLMDYNARYYDPFLGRFISPDPIVPEPTSSGGLNRYRYARNNPVKYNDPSGHCVFVVDTAACVIGAAYAFGIVGAALTIKYSGVLDPAAEQAGAGIKEALQGIPLNEGTIEPLPGYGPGELTFNDPLYQPGPTLGGEYTGPLHLPYPGQVQENNSSILDSFERPANWPAEFTSEDPGWWVWGEYIKEYAEGAPPMGPPGGAVGVFDLKAGDIVQVGVYNHEGVLIGHIEPPKRKLGWHYHEFFWGNPSTGHGKDAPHTPIKDLKRQMQDWNFPDDWDVAP